MSGAVLTTLLLGGARSGKSTVAQRLAAARGGPVTVLVTADRELAEAAGDDELVARIERHRDDRPPGWTTVEVADDLADRLVDAAGTVILDCITLWLSGRLMAGRTPCEIEAELEPVVAAMTARTEPTIVVSNEVGWGLVPVEAESRGFRDLQGRANQRLARACDRTVLLMAGRAVSLDLVETVLPELDEEGSGR